MRRARAKHTNIREKLAGSFISAAKRRHPAAGDP
jgi:hypothetical protein